MRVLVTGASGYVGSRLVAALLDSTERPEVVAVSRDVEKLRPFDWFDDVTALAMDVGDPDSCAKAFDAAGQVDVAYYLVHAIDEADYRDRDRESAETFASTAADSGVERIVYLGGFVPDDDTLSTHLASRAEVGEALFQDGIDVVWLRAAIVLGAGSTSFELVRYVSDRLLALPLPSWMNKPVQPIAVDDLLYYLLAALECPPGSYDVGGAEAVPYRDVLFAYIRAAGLHRVGVPTPGVPTALAGPILGLLLPGSASLIANLVDSLNNTMTVGAGSIRAVVADPPDGFTTIAEAMTRALRTDGAQPSGVRALDDPLQLADTDARWTGGDVLSIRRRVRALVPAQARDVVDGLASRVPEFGPISGGLRTGLDFAYRLGGRA